jgi:hypothetical protein
MPPAGHPHVGTPAVSSIIGHWHVSHMARACHGTQVPATIAATLSSHNNIASSAWSAASTTAGALAKYGSSNCTSLFGDLILGTFGSQL